MLEKVCLDLLRDTRLLWAKPAKTPLDPSVKFYQDSEKRLVILQATKDW